MTTMFCVGKATADWLGDLRRSGSFEEADLEELGSHLEDEVRQLVDHGLSEKEAFWVAMSRVGTRNDLPGEYAKTNSRVVWRHRFWWMAAGILGYLGFNYVIQYLFYGGAIAAASAGIDGVPLIVISLLFMIVVNSGAFLIVWRLLPRIRVSGSGSRLHRIRQSRRRTVLLYLLCVAAAVVLVGLSLCGWFYMPHPGYEVSVRACGWVLASDIFAVLFAVSLVSVAFLVTQPAKRDPNLALER